jgi:predicted Zn-dependent protease
VLAALGGIAGSFLGLSEVASRPGRSLIGGHSRDQEREADGLGQKMALESGWDPAAMTAFLQKLERDTIIALGARPEESLLDSHPATEERVVSSRERAAELGAAPPATPEVREGYLAQIRGLTLGQDPRSGVFEKELFLQPDLDLRIRFPEDWTLLNRPAFVAAVDPPVQVRVELAGKSDEDLEDLARAFAEKQRGGGSNTKKGEAGAADAADKDGEKGEKKDEEEKPEFPDFVLKKGGTRLLGGGRKAYGLDAEFLRGQGVVRIYFVAVGERAYRVSCAMPRQLVATYMEDCDRTASSMRTLAPGDREKVRWVTLEIETAQDGESLRAFGVRTKSHWTESQTAAANGLTLPYKISAGQRLKIARVRPYTPEDAGAASPPPPPAPAPTSQPPAPPRPGDVQIEVDKNKPVKP